MREESQGDWNTTMHVGSQHVLTECGCRHKIRTTTEKHRTKGTYHCPLHGEVAISSASGLHWDKVPGKK